MKIVGYDWEDIQAMQQRQYTAPQVQHTANPEATPQDIERLDELGLAELEAQQLYGVIDRLRTSKLI